MKKNKSGTAAKKLSYISAQNYIDGLNNTSAFKSSLSSYNLGFKLLILFVRLITLLFYSVFYLLKILWFVIYSICQQNKTAKILITIAAVLCAIALIDFIAYYGKIYPGVYVGDIDLSNKTVEEAESLIDEAFQSRLSGNNVVIYVNDEARQAGESDEGSSGLSEQLSVEQARETVKYWKTNSVELEASLPTKDIVDTAANSTRGLQNIFMRLGALLFKQIIKPYADYNSNALQSQIDRVNDTIGSPVINPTCIISEAIARPVDGVDGRLVNNEEFISQLNEAFFKKDSTDSNFVPKLYEAKQKVSFRSAEILAEKINSALQKNVVFEYKNTSWEVSKLNLSEWIQINIEQRQEGEGDGCSCSLFNKENYAIVASIDGNSAGSDIFNHTKDQNITNDDYSIKFRRSGENISVLSDGDFEMPSIYDAVEKLQTYWLKDAIVYENNKTTSKDNSNSTDAVHISISSTQIPKKLNLNEALDIGVVSVISTYTTTYSSGAGTENRNKNISLASESLNNTIAEANGGRWSFNETVGDTTIERGYTEAGAIVGDRYTKSIGGGVCQVATTIFNAVYDSGLPIISRHNHDLHMASYPAGRDAAISYPYLDFIWSNSLNSDCLVRSSTTGYSITCDIISVDPQFSVVSEIGEWTAGEHYKSENVIDPAKEPNSKYTQTSGSDGKSIVVTRKVYGKNSNLVSEEVFASEYLPKTEIIVYGPGEEANKLLAEGNARMKKEDDNW